MANLVVQACEPSLFWRGATLVVLGGFLLIFVAAAFALAMAFLRGAQDDDDDDDPSGGGERTTPTDPDAHVAPDPRVLAARARLDAAARHGGDVARLHGMSAPIARVAFRPRASQGFRR